MKVKVITETRHTDGSIVINTGTHVKVIKPNGTKKVYTAEKYHLIEVIKHVGAFLAAIVVMLTFCGMAAIGDHPAKPLAKVYCYSATVCILLIGLYLLIDWIINTRSGKTARRKDMPCKQKKN